MASGGREGNAVGKQSELVAKFALEELRKEGKILDFKYEDFPGHDFVIWILIGVKMPLEVKSTEKGREQHEKKYRNNPLLIIGNEYAHIPEDIKLELVKKAKLEIMKIIKEWSVVH